MYYNLEQYLVWYYFVIALILGVTAHSSYKHRKQKGSAIPIMWGIIVSLVLVMFAQYLEPILFGFLYYWNVDWYSFTLFAGFTLVWALLMLQCLYNCEKHGSVVE